MNRNGHYGGIMGVVFPSSTEIYYGIWSLPPPPLHPKGKKENISYGHLKYLQNDKNI